MPLPTDPAELMAQFAAFLAARQAAEPAGSATSDSISFRKSRKPARKRLPEFLRPAESEAIVSAPVSERDRLILLCGLGAGLRCSEIVRLRIEDIDAAGPGPQLKVQLGKGKKDRYVPLPPFLVAALARWIGDRRIGWVFPSPRKPDRPLTTRAVQYLVGRVKGLAGIVRRCSPHTLRHSYATDLLRSGADITEVQELLGHSSPNVTARYLHCDPSRLQGVVARLSLGRADEKSDEKTA
jgi:integrase/recombinase XerD